MYIGIDTSTRSVCLGVLDRIGDKLIVEWYWQGLEGGCLFDKMDEAYKYTKVWIEDNIESSDEVAVGIEEPVYIQNGKTHMMLSCIYGSVVKAFMDSNIYPKSVNISVWKKSVTGKGNAKKEAVRKRIVELCLIPDDLEQDVYDALGVSAYMYKG